MTQPDPPVNPAEDERLKRVMERGATTTLDIKRKFAQAAVRLEPARPVLTAIAPADTLRQEITNETEVHLVLDMAYAAAPEYATLIFLNTPDADQKTPLTAPGFVGCVGFFGDESGAHHSGKVVRLPVTEVVKRLGDAKEFTATLVPVAHPGGSPGKQPVTVTAALEVVVSKAVKN